MMVSFIDGRVRLRSPALRSEKSLAEIQSGLSAYPGVKKTESNARTGSLLVFYDPAAISRELLGMAVASLAGRLPAPAPDPGRRRCMLSGIRLRKLETRLMCCGALTALAGAVAKAKPLHVAGGMLFFLLAGRHLYVRRKAL